MLVERRLENIACSMPCNVGTRRLAVVWFRACLWQQSSWNRLSRERPAKQRRQAIRRASLRCRITDPGRKRRKSSDQVRSTAVTLGHPGDLSCSIHINDHGPWHFGQNRHEHHGARGKEQEPRACRERDIADMQCPVNRRAIRFGSSESESWSWRCRRADVRSPDVRSREGLVGANHGELDSVPSVASPKKCSW